MSGFLPITNLPKSAVTPQMPVTVPPLQNCNANINVPIPLTVPIITTEAPKLTDMTGLKAIGENLNIKPQEIKISDIRPSEFKKNIEVRTDIPETIREYILTQEELNLYDELMSLEPVQQMDFEAKEKFFSSFFNNYILLYKNRKDVNAQLEILPGLIKKGYDPQMLTNLHICENNKDIVEDVLKRTDLPEKYEKYFFEHFGNSVYLGDRNRVYNEILKTVDQNSFKYIDECLELTANFDNLPYWTDDTGKILREFFSDIKPDRYLLSEFFDRLHRNGHTYESVKTIFGDKKMTAVTQRLLEYKKFDRFKDIGLEEFDKLSTEHKKEFIRGYISAVTPKELLYPNHHNLETGLEELQKSMKIYEGLNPETTETLVNSYYDILRSLLNKLPESERTVIRSAIDTKYYRRQYRLDNPIPSLVDELENVLKTENRIINGKTVKYAEMPKNVEFGISTHRFPCPQSILTIEALEETDSQMLLCVGTKGGRDGRLNADPRQYALIVKPRRAEDWHVQACSDIDSGNNASKNIYNFEHISLPRMGNHCGAIDLIPNSIKNELNLSQEEYTSRMQKLKDCRTLEEIGEKDSVMEKAIRKVIKEQKLYEGLMRTETMGIIIPDLMPLEEVSDDIINYCLRRNIPLVRVVKPETEIVQDFKNLGIDVEIIDDYSYRHAGILNSIKEDITYMKGMGLGEFLPKKICLSDWRDIEKTKEITSKYGLNIDFPPDRRAYCGASSGVIFINSSEEAQRLSGGIFKKFLHEVGHRIHLTYTTPDGILISNGANSVLGQGIQDNLEFADKQLEVLGIDGKVAKIKGFNAPYNFAFPFKNKFIPLQSGKVLTVDTSKMTAYMNEQCHCYNKDYLSEQVAEIFEDLLKGREFDDLTMLMYDFAGGGRIPNLVNLVFKGRKYDNYIKSLYENKELVNKLKEYILIK